MENTFKVSGNSIYLYTNTESPQRYISKPRVNQPVLDIDFIKVEGRVYFRCQRNYFENL